MRILFTALLLLPFASWACPDLSGKYAACRSTTSTTADISDLLITQSVKNGTTTFKLTTTDTETRERTTEEVKADGKLVIITQADAETGTELKVAQIALCVGKTVLKISQKVFINGEPTADLVTTFSKSGSSLIRETSGAELSDTISEKVICE